MEKISSKPVTFKTSDPVLASQQLINLADRGDGTR
jgi:hypothetical protein